jgi:hypothetical protein
MKYLKLVFASVVFATRVLSAAELTNADVIKMATAKLDDPIIVTAIENSETKFDVSAQGLIDLSTAKVSPAVISAMIKRAGAPAKEAAAKAAPAAAPAAVADASDLMSPSEILLQEGDKVRPMKYISPQVRTAARGLGFGGMASYAVLRGYKATERIKASQPAFLVSVPNQAQPDSYLTLASFAVRKNESREVMIGGGYMSYSSGIHRDRVVDTVSEKAADQSKAQKGFTIYKLTPKRPLAAGEYAVILYTGEMHGLVSAWFTSTGNSYFDFGVDP